MIHDNVRPENRITGEHAMETATASAADWLSANGFLNAYIREFDDWRIETSPRSWQNAGFPAQALLIPLGHQSLWVGVQYWSDCGRHRFGLPARCEGPHGMQSRQLNFLSLAKLLVENAGLLTNGSIGAMARFLERIIESHRNLEMLLTLREPELDHLFRGPLSFRQAEQALLVGHSVHPAPKVWQPMTLTEAVQYGPEGGEGFALAWMLVRRQRVHYHSADGVSLEQRVQALIDADPHLTADYIDIRDDYVLLPAHPWQVKRLQRLPALQAAFASQDIIPLASQGSRWHATSSMRSIYNEQAPYMLKFSLSVRLTNSVRHLQPAEAERGCLISKILATPVGQQFSQRFRDFQIMQEPAYVCLLDDAGGRLPDTMLVFRDNPIREQSQRQFNVLASLTQDHPGGGISSLGSLVMEVAVSQNITPATAASRWFAAYLKVAVQPLVLAQADYGLLFGAHQQNLVLGLERGLPVHCYFRDCQGTGFSAAGARLFKLDHNALGESAENQLDNEMANKLFAYYLIVNSTFGVIGALGADGLIPEASLLLQLRTFLQQQMTPQRRDLSFLRAVLESESLWQKGNFICSLADMNENTLADPAAIYRPIDNPIFRVEQESLLAVTQ